MKNRHGFPLMLVGGCGIVCGSLLILFRSPGDSVTAGFLPIWMGIVFFLFGLYQSTRTAKQYKKEFGTTDERDDAVNRKAALLTLFVMGLAYAAALTLLSLLDSENMTALYLVLSLFAVNGLSFGIIRGIYRKRM